MKKKKAYSWRSNSALETKKIGKTIAGLLMPGDVVALRGALGAGKTTLVQGIARGLGVSSKEVVSSPTFVVIHQHEGKWTVYHLDWYRLDKVEGVDAAFAEECFHAGGVTLVEWPERGKNILPKNHIQIEILHAGPSVRRLSLAWKGARKPA